MQRPTDYYNLRPWARWLVDHRLGFILLAMVYLSLPVYLVCSMLEAGLEGFNDWKYEIKCIKKVVSNEKTA